MEEALVSRLEDAVLRLEFLFAGGGSQPSISSFRDLPSASTSASAADLQSDPSILAFDELVAASFDAVSTAAGRIGGEVLEATEIVKKAFAAEKELLVRTKLCQKPDMAGLAEFLKPLNDVIVKANALTEGKPSDVFNHLKTVADSLSALSWIAYSGKKCGMSLPVAHIEESWQMAEFYNNKILVEYKNKGPEHVEWAKALKELYVPGLRTYVKTYYPLGPVWSSTGAVIATRSTTASSPPARDPAPPPPPSSSLFSSETSSSPLKEGMSAVFQEISSGESVTAGLRKVTDDMKTKNITNRSGVVIAAAKESPMSSFSHSKTGPPKFELQMGRKWVVENQVGKKDLVIDDCDSKQSVYVYGCKNSVLQVRGKVNNITVDKCTKMGIVFTDVVAAFEIVNCNGVEIQSQGSAPTISIDNTAGCQLYLSKDSLQTSITTAKSSEINVLVPGEGPDADWGEQALPQQYVHTFQDGHFVTSPVSHSGA